MHHIIARITAKPDFADQVAAALIELALASRKEAGNRAYDLFQVEGQPAVFMTVEQWDDKAAADAHMTTPHLHAALAKVGSVLAAPPEILQVNPRT